MKLAVVGTGYIGLVTGACFAEMGNSVWCVDVDERKIENLKKGIIPIYEPGLEPIVKENFESGRLHFTTSLAEAMKHCNVYFIGVGTPPGEDGSADLQYVLAVAREIGCNLGGYGVVVNKSTVPVGTADKVRAAVREELEKRGVDYSFDVVSNPEFLKEGEAVKDCLKPDRIVIGVDNERSRDIMEELYAPFNRNHQRTLFVGIRDAEMTKYTANAMLATKISFMNEISNMCELLDVDVENVRLGIGSDSRIGYSFIYPGCGYGGSCFPKDVKALLGMAREIGYDSKVLRAVEDRNDLQRQLLFKKIVRRFGDDLSSHTIAVWGLSFKPGTDDLREASSRVLVNALIGAGAKVRGYDPVAMDNVRKEWPAAWFEKGGLTLTVHQYEALKNADAVVLVTEWKPFRIPDFEAMKRLMKQPVIFDGRNQYDPAAVKAAGFEYQGIGRK
ncbi:MAG: UDP-glucose/GDP-mannose dehydrogenase family protein [Deltaproteobacteria bacterium]|nr:UDP-glucose/GDP-mannose dehydrogenase family protein [Deltaproteobacteria bacterium]